MPKLVWLNGQVMPLESATVTVADHAHLYGDGLFEGIRIYSSKVFKLDEHLERLFHGCTYLGFKMKYSHAELKAIVLDVCHQAGVENGYIRLNVTRGTGLGLDPKNIDQDPNVMVMVNTLALYPPEFYAKGLDAITSSIRVIPADSLDPRIKCIGRYAGNILAKHEANQKGAEEAMMLNHRGEIAECTGENVFLVKGKTIRTPHSSSGILLGITRNTILEIARRKGFETTEEALTVFDLFTSDEVFLTGTAAEVIGLVSLDGRKIGTGAAGPVSKMMLEALHEEAKSGTPF